MGKRGMSGECDGEGTQEGTGAKGARDVRDEPKTPDALHDWLCSWLDVDLARQSIVPGHSAPFDYIRWAFLDDEQRGLGQAEAQDGNPGPGGGVREEGGEGGGEGVDPVTHALSPDGVVWANRGGGKTFLGAVATLLDMVFKSGIEVRILAGSMEQASRMHEHLRVLLERRGLCDLVQGKMTDRRIELVNGSRVELLSQSQTSVRGTRVQRLRCDEVELFDPEVWEAAQLTTRSKWCGDRLVAGSIECFSTMHVPHGLMHRIVAEAREGKRRLFKWGVVDVLGTCGEERRCGDPSAACWVLRAACGGSRHPGLGTVALDPQHAAHSTQRVCPLWDDCGGRAKERTGNLTNEGIGHITIDDALAMKARVSKATWEAEMMCLRAKRDDAVLAEFDAKVHVLDDSQMAKLEEAGSWAGMWIGGMDFGYRSPTVILWAAYDEVTRRLYVMDEHVQTGRTVAQHAETIVGAKWPPLAWIGVDPAGKQVNDQTGEPAVRVLERAGFTVRASNVTVPRGLELVRARLRPADEQTSGGPRLFVHERCVKLIGSLEKYHYPVNDPESVTPEKDGSDHAVDALRYMVQNLDGVAGAKSSLYAK